MEAVAWYCITRKDILRALKDYGGSFKLPELKRVLRVSKLAHEDRLSRLLKKLERLKLAHQWCEPDGTVWVKALKG